ncbi:MAG: 6-carboxytetrahydropterin synthase [Bacteroidales bacterium]|nr:6-carboxytetrahydropterin synthase [Bacteroidales bacterium]MCL2738781.1 6-carboxytetrahydropterin synthase [Bacteroidales bacterium]
MNIIRLTKEFRFEGAHALRGYEGKCRHIHGHSYLLRVTVSGVPDNRSAHPTNGMIMDFGALKELVNLLIIQPFDHALLLREDAPLTQALREEYQNVLVLPFQPTCEQLCIHFASLLAPAIPEPAKLFSIRLYETPNSFAEWFALDNL